MTTTYYRMEMTYHGVRMTITNFDREQYETSHELTPASFNRFTAIAQQAAQEQHPARTFELLQAQDDEIFFGWEIVHQPYRNCPKCQDVILEFLDEYAEGGNCWMCDFLERAERAGNEHAEKLAAQREAA